MKQNGKAWARTLLCAVCAVLLILSVVGQPVSAKTSVKVGSTVEFGKYHKYTIEWKVLAVDGDKALLISTLALDVLPYDEGDTAESTTWENCSLREWLNDDFLYEAFSSTERNSILTTTLENPGYTNGSGQYIKGGNDTRDKIFLLSMDEVKEYFSNNKSRKAGYTSYAASQGANVYDQYGGPCYWWLRSPGLTQNRAACVDINGYPYRDGSYVNYIYAAVRPAMWVDIG